MVFALILPPSIWTKGGDKWRERRVLEATIAAHAQKVTTMTWALRCNGRGMITVRKGNTEQRVDHQIRRVHGSRSHLGDHNRPQAHRYTWVT